MRTIVVYRAKNNRDRSFFLIWKLINKSGIGYEEIHYTDLHGDPADPGDHIEIGFEYSFVVDEEDLIGSEGS